MKDDRGLYYYPFPTNKRVRMYVEMRGGDICFRMWNQDDAEMWEEHGWIPHDAIQQAAAMYSGDSFDPQRAYDIEIAKALLKEAGN